MVLVHPAGHRCGYVGVTESHHKFGQDYDGVLDIQVHGGLTFAGGGGVYPIDSPGIWWFGYDCGHSQDRRDPALMSGEYKQVYEKYERQLSDILTLSERGIIRSLEFCQNECESLARQLTENAK